MLRTCNYILRSTIPYWSNSTYFLLVTWLCYWSFKLCNSKIGVSCISRHGKEIAYRNRKPNMEQMYAQWHSFNFNVSTGWIEYRSSLPTHLKNNLSMYSILLFFFWLLRLLGAQNKCFYHQNKQWPSINEMTLKTNVSIALHVHLHSSVR